MNGLLTRRLNMSWWSGPNRYLCSVLDEMRKHVEKVSVFNLFQYKRSMAMLIEEAQTLANRMETGLSDWSDVRRAHKEIKELKAEIKLLESKRDSLKETESDDK
jgi:uncharacterized protein Yka (UPF0111/DUF47 family)